jgi:hypothetical protein
MVVITDLMKVNPGKANNRYKYAYSTLKSNVVDETNEVKK